MNHAFNSNKRAFFLLFFFFLKMTLFLVYLTKKIYINIQAIFGILSADDGLKGGLLHIEKQCCCTQDTHICSYNYNQNFI